MYPSAAAADEDSDFRAAAAFFQDQRWQYAADEFQQFLKDYPDSAKKPLARLYVGLCQSSLEEYEPARTSLQQFLEAAPENRNAADARYRIGECSYYLKEYGDAVQQLTSYLEKHDGHHLNSWGRLLLGESFNHTQQFVKAEDVLNQVLSVSAKDGIQDDVEFALGVTFQGQNQREKAQQQFSRLVDRKSGRFEHRALARLGMMAFDADEFRTAAEFYDQLINDHSQKSATPTAALQSGIAYFQLRDYEEAIKRFQKIPQTAPAFDYGQLWTGLALVRLDRTEEARKVFSENYQTVTDPKLLAELLFRRAELEMTDQQPTTAVAMFRDLTERWPKSGYVVRSLFNIADLQLELGEVAEAESAIQRLLDNEPQLADDAHLLTLRGRLLLNKGETKESIRLLTKAVEDPKATKSDLQIRTYHLVRAFNKEGMHAEVIERVEPMVDDLMEGNQADVAAMLSLAAISSLELDHNESAIRFANQFVKLSPNVATQTDALTARAIASSRIKDFEQCRADLKTLVDSAEGQPATWIAVLQSAEAAWAVKSYSHSAEFFDLATGQKMVPRIRRMALSGAGWSYYRLNDSGKAKDRLIVLARDFPDAVETTEGRYLLGRILLDEKQESGALDQFKIVYEILRSSTKEKNANPDEVRFFLSSGHYFAKLLGQLDRVDEANAVWKDLAGVFDQSSRLDEILDEWAVLNLQNGNYEESDRIYQTLLDRFPKSRFAGQAKLSLAESLMQEKDLQPAFDEFVEIVGDSSYNDRERAAALYHIVDIQAAREQWDRVVTDASKFLQSFPNHDRASDIQLLSADAAVNLGNYKDAVDQLSRLRNAILSGDLPKSEWAGRVWVLLAEVALAEKRYADVDRNAEEMDRSLADSRWKFQMRFLQGRRWKSQAPPDFAKSRQYFQAVTSDESVQGTDTAARSQFLIAETYLLQKAFKNAAREYHRVHLIYDAPEWKARSLFQAAQCEEQIGNQDEAIRSYKDLVDHFPQHKVTEKAKERLRELKATPNAGE